MKCEQWADGDGPLSYRFGWATDGAQGVTWLQPSRVSHLFMGFPSGTVHFYAQVSDPNPTYCTMDPTSQTPKNNP